MITASVMKGLSSIKILMETKLNNSFINLSCFPKCNLIMYLELYKGEKKQFFRILFHKISVDPILNFLSLTCLKSDSHLSKKKSYICFTESPLKIMKNAFHLILKALFVLKIFKFLSWLFGHVRKRVWLER